VGVLATAFPDGIDQAAIFPMGKYNPGYVLPRVAVDDDNVGTVLDPAADLVDAVDIQVCVNEDRSLKRQRSVQPKHNLALGLIWGSHCCLHAWEPGKRPKVGAILKLK
jgi:hypothetical protein